MLGWLLCNIHLAAPKFHEMIVMKDNTMTWKASKFSNQFSPGQRENIWEAILLKLTPGRNASECVRSIMTQGMTLGERAEPRKKSSYNLKGVYILYLF